MKNFFKLILILFSVSIFAQEEVVLQKAEKIVDYPNLVNLVKEVEYGKVAISTPIQDENTLLVFETTNQPKFIYNFGSKIPTKSVSLKKGQTILLKFKARTINALLETGEARIMWVMKQSLNSKDGYKYNIESTTSVSKEWKTYYIPFEATQDIDDKNLSIVMQLGFPPQKFELTNLQLYLFPQGFDVSQLPKTKIYYLGMEEDSPWRNEAKDRIEKIRKTDFTITFLKNGKPIANKDVQITLDKHNFNFGVAVDAIDIVKEPKHLDFIKKYFNTVVLENDLKIKSWQNLKKQPITLDAIEILRKNNIEIKGHALLWPGFQYLTPAFKENAGNPQKIKELNDNFINDILLKTKGNISHWDVANENYTNKDLQKITGSNQIIYDAFLKAKMLAPESERFINEYGIISSGGIDKAKQDWYYNYVKEIDKNTGNAVDGIGMQSHIGSDLTPPTTIISILNRFGTLGKKLAISEFTMDITDPEIRGKYTRDFMISAFSNPAVDEFMFWGYYEPKSDKAGLADKDFQLTKMGQAYADLVKKEWTTNTKLTTNKIGKVSGRGFYGFYTYTLSIDHKKYVGVLRLEKGVNNNYVIDLK